MDTLKMYDYMQALQDKFFQEPEFPELEQQMDQGDILNQIKPTDISV